MAISRKQSLAAVDDFLEHHEDELDNSYCLTWNQQERPKWRFEGRTEPLYRWVAGAKYIGLDDGIVVRHTCDNPYCFNPDHLVKGTTADNNHDRKGCTYK